ncbi:MAG TPA: hypothetical protein VLM37_11680 [Fibrobacteraceae bacterium]|nr:hypothetical protein [Fibrobacteraceae bacterium]
MEIPVPTSTLEVSLNPRATSRELIRKACADAARHSGALSLPGGPVGLLIAIPDLMNLWRIQSQLVADIAACHGKSAALGSREMGWCLFRHAAAQVTRGALVKSGQRAVVAYLGQRGFRHFAAKILPRAIPFLGALAAGGYAWMDTRKVGDAALEMFGIDLGHL